jgi:hypothetical protein
MKLLHCRAEVLKYGVYIQSEVVYIKSPIWKSDYADYEDGAQHSSDAAIGEHYAWFVYKRRSSCLKRAAASVICCTADNRYLGRDGPGATWRRRLL